MDCMSELINYLYDDTITIYYTVPKFMYFMYFYENCNHCKIVLWPFPHPLGLHPEMDKRKNKDDDDDDHPKTEATSSMIHCESLKPVNCKIRCFHSLLVTTHHTKTVL